MKCYLEIFFTCLLCHSLPAFAGHVDTVDVYSPSMHKQTKCVVITPESYTDSPRKFPVLYLLHGYGGDYTSWLKLDPDLAATSDRLAMIIVCPDGGYRSWYIDSPVDSTMKYETYIVGEIVPFIDSVYHTMPDKKHRAITGLSMGGHGGLFLGFRHTDLFGAAGSTSGGLDIRQFTSSWELKEKILGDTICCKQNWEDYTVINVLDELPLNALEIIIDCGTEDFFIDVNRSMHQKMLSLGVAHDYIERPGKHDSSYWRNSIEYQLLFFSRFFALGN